MNHVPTFPYTERILDLVQKRSSAPPSDYIAKVLMDYGAAVLAANAAADTFQQTDSKVTATCEKPTQVIDSGAAGPNRTGDLLITNQSRDCRKPDSDQPLKPDSTGAASDESAQVEPTTYEGVTATPAFVIPAGTLTPVEADAARYRWLRNSADGWAGSPRIVCGILGVQSYIDGPALDRGIDDLIRSARAAQVRP